jgi:5-methyltetrahydrofolate--homocysteine methyltransferase
MGSARRYRKGNVLYWQGDPVEHIFVVVRGAVKVSSISRDGRAYTYDILGPEGLIGATAYLLGGDHESMAEALEDTDVLLISPTDFEHMLSSDPLFSAVVMRHLALGIHRLSDKARDLSFLDVQQRLKHSLARLADEHGLATENGIKIDLDITHEEIGALVAANRTTITACLSELKRLGYLWTEGRRLVIIPPRHIEILDNLSRSVIYGADQDALRWASRAVEAGVDPIKALNALTSAMKQVDRSYTQNEIDLPDVVLAAYAMKGALPTVEKEIKRTGQQIGSLGTVIIGTVLGDIHDIGKTLVTMLLKARGFEVIDLGVDVASARFVWAVRKHRPNVLALSALTTVSAPEQGKVIHELRKEGLRDGVKIMVGGGAVTQTFADQVGADGYAPTARGAVELAWRLCTWL